MKVKEFIQMVNEGEFWSLGAVDNSDLGEGFERIESGNDLDEHRWYSTAEDIYKLEDGYVEYMDYSKYSPSGITLRIMV